MITRAMQNGDRKFVVSAWSSSYKASHFAGLITAEDWASVMHVQLGKIIDRPTTRTLVAVGPRDFIYGFICGDVSQRVPIVHYVFVKDGFRSERRGGRREGPRYARALFAALGVDPGGTFLYTCRTPVVTQLEESKIPRATFRPAAARYTNYQEQQQHEQRQ